MRNIVENVHGRSSRFQAAKSVAVRRPRRAAIRLGGGALRSAVRVLVCDRVFDKLAFGAVALVCGSVSVFGQPRLRTGLDVGSAAVHGRPVHAASWYEIARAATSPEDICRAVQARVRYVPDDIDTWTGGRETWERGYGDCEDFAAAVVDLCALAGFPAEIRIYYPRSMRGQAHAVAVGEWRGERWMSSNGKYSRVVGEQAIREENARILNKNASDLLVMAFDRLPEDREHVLQRILDVGGVAPRQDVPPAPRGPRAQRLAVFGEDGSVRAEPGGRQPPAAGAETHAAPQQQGAADDDAAALERSDRPPVFVSDPLPRFNHYYRTAYADVGEPIN